MSDSHSSENQPASFALQGQCSGEGKSAKGADHAEKKNKDDSQKAKTDSKVNPKNGLFSFSKEKENKKDKEKN